MHTILHFAKSVSVVQTTVPVVPSSECCSLISSVDGESFQHKLLKTSGQLFL